ncbi:sulfotransferase domain-containing protein [uncultured Parvibaculum sp.]|uniref:sulfotransferase domain-containing protein n=1 Tax=uncultured Parvibaculum sp. TaxID=291828 RepID=UPI0030DD5530|tara:strand:+ start:17989 stop:18912 length:924 start_codon:yes stop_codon:yes gene_type:complete
MDSDVTWPKKSRELHSNHFQSTVWNDFKFRNDDIVISTYGKAGTTWTQQIVGQLIFNGAEDVPVSELSPWLDLRVPPPEIKLPLMEAQTHRRFMKTHLPVDALVYSPQAKYIYIGRDGRDVLWSMYHHHANANDAFYDALNETPGLVGEKLGRVTTDVKTYFNTWIEKDGYPFWSFWENVSGWWAIRHLPNILVVHFENLKRDMPGEIRRIAAFLDIPIDETRWPAILEHCSFDYMKKNADKSAPLGGALWEGGASTFINKGTNGRWRDALSAEESAAYEALAREKLGDVCARWLMTGEGLDVARTA